MNGPSTPSELLFDYGLVGFLIVYGMTMLYKIFQWLGEKILLPVAEDLCKMMRATTTTLQKTLAQLEAQGIILAKLQDDVKLVKDKLDDNK